MNLRDRTHHTAMLPRILFDYRIRPDRMTGRPDQIANAQTAVRDAIDRRQLSYQLRTTVSGWRTR
ncbi:MAG TPA: hypothetical protein VES40_18465 [Ilumatobacteraceae bacterium]|nr:hypothetical protein [Ilumatobacteraceae bacterium]